MIKSPIQEVTSKMQARAIGIIFGSYKPYESNLINKGQLIDNNGVILDCVVLGKTLPLIKKHIDFEKNYFWIVYPRNKNIETIHIQIAGVWEPFEDEFNYLKSDQEVNDKLDSLNLKNNFFSIRGKLIFINSEEKEIVIKVSILKTTKKSNNKPFKITIKGEISMDYLNSFISVDAIRKDHSLLMQSYEIIES